MASLWRSIINGCMIPISEKKNSFKRYLEYENITFAFMGSFIMTSKLRGGADFIVMSEKPEFIRHPHNTGAMFYTLIIRHRR
jgi:hypothetical protein